MGKVVDVDTSIELCAGNVILAPGSRTFNATKQDKGFKFVEVKNEDENKEKLYHIGGKDACRVSPL